MNQAASSMAPSTTATEGTNRSRLLKLPAELRIAIYELAFTTDHDDTEEIDLTTAKPPGKNLLLVCRQTNNEARRIYKDSYRQFWQTSNFTMDPLLDFVSREAFKNKLSTLKARDVEQISQLQVRFPRESYTLLDKRGGWSYTACGRRRESISHAWFGYSYMGAIQAHYGLSERQMRECCDRTPIKQTSLQQKLLDFFT